VRCWHLNRSTCSIAQCEDVGLQVSVFVSHSHVSLAGSIVSLYTSRDVYVHYVLVVFENKMFHIPVPSIVGCISVSKPSSSILFEFLRILVTVCLL
jgi:hypothetical protein